jgi:hypothetical protein
MTELRVLTVRQPWAWAIIHGGKDVENRATNIVGGYRGPLAIHAGLDFDRDGRLTLRAAVDLPQIGSLDYGQIIGVVDLVDVYVPARPGVPAYDSSWALPDHYNLVLAHPRPLAHPIPHRGALGLRRLPDDITERIQLDLAVAERSA